MSNTTSRGISREIYLTVAMGLAMGAAIAVGPCHLATSLLAIGPRLLHPRTTSG